jgi:hypothetical protein
MDYLIIFLKIPLHIISFVFFASKLLMNILASFNLGKKGICVMPGVELLLIPFLLSSNPFNSDIYSTKNILLVLTLCAITSYIPMLYQIITKGKR